MSTLTWDDRSKFLYESGVDRGVFYPIGAKGVAWNGLSAVKEASESSVENVYYVDGTKYTNQITLGDYSAVLEAFTYPDEFAEYDGTYDDIFTNQPRKTFNLSYRTKIGDAINGLDLGYKIHLIYNAQAAPSDRDYSSVGADISPITFSWDITTVPEVIDGIRPTSHLIIDSRYVWVNVLETLEEMLYGTETSTPHFPSIDEVFTIFEENSLFRIIDHVDGSFTATSPLSDGDLAYVKALSGGVIELMSPTVIELTSTTYSATTL